MLSTRSLIRILSEPYISATNLIICFFVTDFVRKMGARPGLTIDPLIPFNAKKMGFLPNKAFCHQ